MSRAPGRRGGRLSSVRAKASLGATLVVAVALVAAGLAVLLSLRSDLTDQADRQADAAAREVALDIIAEQVPGRTPYSGLELPGAEEHPVQVADEQGRLIAVSDDLEGISGTGVAAVTPVRSPAPRPTAAGQDDDDAAENSGSDDDAADDNSGDDSADDNGSGGGGDNSRHSGGSDDDDDPAIGAVGEPGPLTTGRATVDGAAGEYRFASIEVTDTSGRTVVVHAGATLAARQSAVGTAAAAMLVGLPVLLLVVGGVTWLVTRRALRPVEGIRREMAAITASEDLSRRVPEPATHDEVARLARTTNETLTALEASVERQRRFVADASHELRSPIASLRTQLEVGDAHPGLLDVPGAVADTVRLQQLAADLLLLARLDAGERPGQARFDLGDLAAEEIAVRTTDRVKVSPEAGEEPGRSLEVTGSRGQLARVLGNLLDNAQRHAASSVTVSVHRRAGRIVLAVADDGPGVPEAERERVFERFVRLDDARARDDGGAGLGLAIARDVAHRHGGTLTVTQAPLGGARFELALPPA
ncbi:HAMP domain-containing histidine kinase [Streptomyces sp. NBC_01317]|uniref:HAMP domain-containing sensor histidine kinase n=1 Tax=Streptomyces sp. NBC_01317 TaxID=2903822 RepID=UPI002E13A3F6|nr:HAMP domain-containing histidine kinase [Streptomyces sp. NBC_01317]